MKTFCVYILSSVNRTLYIGVTGDLKRRIWEHKNKVVPGFTERYNIDRLVHYEQTENVYSALEREKQLKKWRREKKIFLIEKENPSWEDLYPTL
ncbi:MAG: GIY-YIG nuclease family protein [Candidatus Moranbacteria bacterium]|nr:GIY-YIG nuclease family protein [Candidatus Moranbacteria bacterium]NTW46285.1 GIY-YIG nuclease family protein [Candidatus Moranbacteria bacterium]